MGLKIAVVQDIMVHEHEESCNQFQEYCLLEVLCTVLGYIMSEFDVFGVVLDDQNLVDKVSDSIEYKA